MGERDICHDDSDWLKVCRVILKHEVEFVSQDLAASLRETILKCYHGCRTADATSYLSSGIHRHDSRALAEWARELVASRPSLNHLQYVLDRRIAEMIERFPSDQGKLFLCLDDRFLLDCCGHYLLYGSEWIGGLLGESSHAELRSIGVPTILELELPSQMLDAYLLDELATKMLQEWTHRKVNKRAWVPKLDFAIPLTQDISPRLIVGHIHPKEVRDPLHQMCIRISPRTYCEACKPIEESGKA